MVDKTESGSVVGLSESQLESKLVFNGRLLQVYVDQVLLPDGTEGVREYIKHPGAVVIIPVLDNGDLLFERQYRYPVGQIFWELPAGKIDPGESVEQTAIRELLEETGYEATSWRHLGVMHPCIGYSDERIEVFLAQGLRQLSQPMLDEGEFLEIFPLAPSQIREYSRRGAITDAKTLTALYMMSLHQDHN